MPTGDVDRTIGEADGAGIGREGAMGTGDGEGSGCTTGAGGTGSGRDGAAEGGMASLWLDGIGTVAGAPPDGTDVTTDGVCGEVGRLEALAGTGFAPVSYAGTCVGGAAVAEGIGDGATTGVLTTGVGGGMSMVTDEGLGGIGIVTEFEGALMSDIAYAEASANAMQHRSMTIQRGTSDPSL